MRRRKFIRYTATSAITAIGMLAAQNSQAQNSNSVTIEYLGHSSFLFTGDGLKVLVNPFRPIGCTAGYDAPNVQADLVLISSFLLDEGAVEEVVGNPQIFTEPGDYQTKGVKFQGITTPHDREGGRRFGKNIVWRWNQGGVTILHLGGAAAPITLEQKILMGTPDVLLIPVGGSAKAYNPVEAQKAVEILNPKVVIPTQYLTDAADTSACDIVPVDEFLALNQNKEIKRLNVNKIAIRPSDLPKDNTVIRVLNYN